MSTDSVPTPPPPAEDAGRVIAAPFVWHPATCSYVARCPDCRTLLGVVTEEAVELRAQADIARGVRPETARRIARPGFARGRHTCPEAAE